ncbi:hypothetical protein SAMN02745121_04505 [Nannocystis exedens]|uniref:YhhN-like protein n=1 Tax=Nannocystis exedens TaxID=54 RepID=A0A1I2B1D6_9BACT|nr:hypothetical protein [Nannocystis exedens]PCC74406.1 hypothetical protein NAEX_07497 [Nannocystis exedens]SFE49859.1 hypothetical protein SAMN02745121_04505 [Nannocystis exedens]
MSTPRLLALVLLLAGLHLGVDPLAAEVLGTIGAVLAVTRFSPGDPPRRPWLLRAVALGLVVFAHVLQRLGLVTLHRLDYVLLIVANILGALALLGFLRVLRQSGLTVPLRRGERVVAVLLGCATLAVVVWILAALVLHSLRDLAVAVSTICDAVVFTTAALLLRHVLPMRGGLVARPYFLLAVDGLCFLALDLAHALQPVPGPTVAPLSALGHAAGGAAGFAQAALVRRGAQPSR